MSSFASRYIELVINTTTGLPLRSTALVLMQTGTGAPGTGTYVTTYTDRTKTTVASSVGAVTTDANGNLAFYADAPGSGGIDLYQGSTLLMSDVRPVQDQANLTALIKGTVTTATNATGTVTSYSGTAFLDVPSTSISLTAASCGPADMWLKWGGVLQQTGAGDSDAFLCVMETTSGTVLLVSTVIKVPGNTRYASFPSCEFSLGVVSSTRTFKLQLFQIITSGTPTWALQNGTANPTYLSAEAR